MRRLFSLLVAILLTASVTGCDLFGDEDAPQPTTQSVFVANQGNFTDGNGSITVYDPISEDVTVGALTDFNSIVQGITIFGSRLYVSANTGGRIDVFNTDQLQQVAQVDSFTGPRYTALTERGAGVITDQSFSGPSSVRIVNFESTSPQIEETIEVPGLPEGVTLTDTRIYAALGGFGDTTLVAAIERQTLELAQTIDVGCAPRFTLADNENDVYAVCSDKAEVVRLNGDSGDILGRIALPDTASTLGPGQTASFSPESDELYVVLEAREVARINTANETVTATIGPVDGEEGIGGVAYDATRQELYLARLQPAPTGFEVQGRVSVHDRAGTEIASFPAGVAPTAIAFRRTAQ